MYIAGFVIPVPEEKMEAYRNMRPALTNLFHDPRHLLDCAICCIQPRRSKLRSQQMPAAENIERQITVAVVISVKEEEVLIYDAPSLPRKDNRFDQELPSIRGSKVWRKGS